MAVTVFSAAGEPEDLALTKAIKNNSAVKRQIVCTRGIFPTMIEGTNRIDPDVDNPDHWLPIVEIEKETADDQELGHTTGHSYDTLMFEVLQGPADVMVSSGVAG